MIEQSAVAALRLFLTTRPLVWMKFCNIKVYCLKINQ
jgi:hypothetical protein